MSEWEGNLWGIRLYFRGTGRKPSSLFTAYRFGTVTEALEVIHAAYPGCVVDSIINEFGGSVA